MPLTLDQPEEQKRMFRLASRPCLIPSDMESWRILKPLPADTDTETRTAKAAPPAKAAQPVTGPKVAKAPAHPEPKS